MMTVQNLDAPASRIEWVLAQIREGVLARDYAPGQPLVEAELARQYGVSKTPVREALKLLSGSGLVVFEPYKGATVRIPTRQLADDVIGVRSLLEPAAVHLSVTRSRYTFGAAAELLNEAAIVAGERARAKLSVLNRRFHAEMYRNCGNAVMIETLDGLRDRMALVSIAGWDEKNSWEKEWGEHRAILDAAADGDADLAATLVRDHIESFRARFDSLWPS
ncbi:putative GntR family transcriptional regulator [Gordonia soli NBRC 108243]|uniref:Putative GntR family transcriptional regulator n=2 Tax=Gordonia soli TaxID=320799 RepID=M0QGG5_9ACTN|nr:putative GntR family transcriptional regulator [Gordonia soli NBRC 108243]